MKKQNPLDRLFNSDAMAGVVLAHLEDSLEIFKETGKGEPDYKELITALKRVIKYYGGSP